MKKSKKQSADQAVARIANALERIASAIEWRNSKDFPAEKLTLTEECRLWKAKEGGAVQLPNETETIPRRIAMQECGIRDAKTFKAYLRKIGRPPDSKEIGPNTLRMIQEMQRAVKAKRGFMAKKASKAAASEAERARRASGKGSPSLDEYSVSGSRQP